MKTSKSMAARFAWFAAFGLMLAATGCALLPQARTDLRVVVVRHAEKSASPATDPALSEAGYARAKRIAAQLAHAPVRAVYATAFRRTQDTAYPTALRHKLSVTVYDAKQPTAAFAAQLRQTHPRGTVLVVGHSNTVPQIVSALCACEVAPMDETSFDHWYEVRITDKGAHLTQTRY